MYGDFRWRNSESASFLQKSKSVGLVIGHQGLGDHIVCNALYRFLATQHSYLIILVTAKKRDAVKQMLGDVPNIKVSRFNSWYEFRGSMLLRRLPSIRICKVYKLGIYGARFWEMGLHFDENYYFQVGIPFRFSHENFKVKYDQQREESLSRLKLWTGSPYVLIHQDVSRNFLIDKSLITNKLPFIEVTETQGYSLFDYRKLILGATEIHAIESSLIAYVDRLPHVSAKLFAHRYARPEAASDSRLQFTYAKEWHVYTESPVLGKKYEDPKKWIHPF